MHLHLTCPASGLHPQIFRRHRGRSGFRNTDDEFGWERVGLAITEVKDIRSRVRPIVFQEAFSRDGKIGITGGNDGTARLWDSATGQALGQPLTDPVASQALGQSVTHFGWVLVTSFSPDGSKLYFSSQRGPLLPGQQLLLPESAPATGLGATYELTIPPQFRGARVPG